MNRNSHNAVHGDRRGPWGVGEDAEKRTHDEEGSIHGGADYWDFEGGGSRGSSQGPEPEVQDLRSDLPPLEGEVRGLEVSEARRLRQFEDENGRLKHLLAEEILDIQDKEKAGAEPMFAHGLKRRAAEGQKERITPNLIG